MKASKCDFPIKTLRKVVMENNEMGDVNKESIIKENWGLTTCKIVSDEFKNSMIFPSTL